MAQVAISEMPLEPRYPAEDLLALINPDIRKPFDMVEILLRLVDDSRLSIFKPSYGTNLLTSFAQIMGMFSPCLVATRVNTNRFCRS